MIDSRVGLLDLDTAVDGYLRYSESLRHEDPVGDAYDRDEPIAADEPDDRDQAAWDALETAIRDAPAPVAWALVVMLLRRAPDDRLGFYAAGPLEELVIHRAAELVGEIEVEARRDERFRWALGCVWVSTEALPDEILARIVRASGGAIKPFVRSKKRT
ncbi:MAG TPA: hypothetical protein VLK84_11390 [Longimicrobium sp.]|nr:hypothetical protein [Longimicrobium sp.]